MADLEDLVLDELAKARRELDAGASSKSTRTDQELSDALGEDLNDVILARESLVDSGKVIESQASRGHWLLKK